jgi:hypothetical protein
VAEVARGAGPHLALALALAGCQPAVDASAAVPEPAARPLEARPSGAPEAIAELARFEPGSGSASVQRLAIGQSHIRVRLDPAGFEGREAAVLAWIERCARAVAGYYGQFPVGSLTIEVRAAGGAGIRGGQALPGSPPTIRISVGRHTPAAAFERNWSMTHEMVHLAFPNVPSAHHWIEEGLATFVEPIARARAGWITEDAVWAEWIESMPLGLPGPGDGGLDGTESWGRTYWGGALYCLIAAVTLLEQSGGRSSFDDALRAILAAGGNITARWPLVQALRAGDAATGESVLVDTYASHKAAPVTIDLDALWLRLGVALEGDRVRYDDSAPLAHVRRAIVAGQR